MLSRRIFFALGFPAGAENEVAESIVWLHRHGVSALEHLHAFLPSLQSNPYESLQVLRDTGSEVELSVESDSGYFALTEAVDFICARTASNKSNQLRSVIHGVANPHLILPLIARRSNNGWHHELSYSVCRVIFIGGTYCTKRALSQLPTSIEPQSVEICSIRRSEQLASYRFVVDELGAQDIAEAGAESTTRRIEISPLVYRELKEVAAKSFVPSSAHSRSRGAGAEVDDSD